MNYMSGTNKATFANKLVGVFLVISLVIFLGYSDIKDKNRTQNEINSEAYNSNDYLPLVCAQIAEGSTQLETKINYPFGIITSNNSGNKMVSINYSIKNMFGSWIKAVAYCEMNKNAHIVKAYSNILSEYVPLLDVKTIKIIEQEVKSSIL